MCVKTIYCADAGKIAIDDGLLAKVNDAVACVEEMSKRNDWRLTIEIDVPGTAKDELHIGDPSGQLILQVAYDRGVQDNAHAQIMRALSGQMPAGKISVDLGEYGYEGWESRIDSKNLLELADIYFADSFIYNIFSLGLSQHDLATIRQVDKEHMPLFGEFVLEKAKHHLESRVEMQSSYEESSLANLISVVFDEHCYFGHDGTEEIAYLKNLVTATDNFCRKKDEVSLEEFMSVISGRLTSEQ